MWEEEAILDDLPITAAWSIFKEYFMVLPSPLIPATQVKKLVPLRRESNDFDLANAKTHTEIIAGLPRVNRPVLLYFLDVLCVIYTRMKEDENTLPDLARFFEKYIMHRDEEDFEQEYKHRGILEFLIKYSGNIIAS